MSAVVKTCRQAVDNRLVYYQEHMPDDYWDEVWVRLLNPGIYEGADKGQLGHYEQFFPRYLPRDGKILEAGCGMGQFVLALRRRGFDCEGVDYAGRTVDAVREIRPDIPIERGDVTALDCADDHYSGLVSLGVIEHRAEGPEPFLDEAYRVLKPGGVALFTVPYYSWLRKLSVKLGAYSEAPPAGYEFYQYAFSKSELEQYCREAGFEVEDFFFYDPWKGLKDEFVLVRWLGKWHLFQELTIGLLNAFGPARRRMSHMVGVVCRKPAA